MICKIRAGSAVRCIAALLFFQLGTFAAENWQLPGAPVRFQLKLTRKPTHPSAGYIAQLPDGGILARNLPSPVVMTREGRELPSYTLWDNPETGFSIVFADPADQTDTVYVYMTVDRQPLRWTPQTGLAPSALLCVNPGQDSMAAARGLARLGRVDSTATVFRKAGVPFAPVSIGGDETGRPRPCVFYLLCYLDAPEDGKYWISPFTHQGTTEVYFNGTKLEPAKRTRKWGGEGAWVDLKRGLQRLEVFQTYPAEGPPRAHNGIFFLAWRTPKDTLEELESRRIKSTEIVVSGECVLQQGEYRDGAPMACALLNPGATFWFENEAPLILYQCQALTGGNPPDTVYTWSLSGKGAVDGSQASWIFPGLRECRVQLEARSGFKSAKYTVPFFSWSNISSSMNAPQHRALFRNTLGTMLAAFPKGADPLADWSDAYWNNLIRSMDYGEGAPILGQLFTQYWDAACKKLSPAQMNLLQDVFLSTLRENPSQALEWLQKFQQGTPDPMRRAQLKLQQAEVQLFAGGDRKSAGEIFSSLASPESPVADSAKIRLGDLAFLEGDLNKAISYYAEVQNRARARRNAPKAATGALVADQLLPGGSAQAAPAPSPALPSFAAPDNSKEQPNSAALQEVSLSENVKTLVQQGFLLEARQTLQRWENEFPLSKVSGDFILRESELYMKNKEWSRARPMLEAYCRTIDASSYLPDAAGLLITCIKQSKEPRESVRELIEKVKERLKYHPVATQLDAFLAGK